MTRKVIATIWLLLVAACGLMFGARMQPVAAQECGDWGGGGTVFCYEMSHLNCSHFCWVCWCGVGYGAGCYEPGNGSEYSAGCEDEHYFQYCPCDAGPFEQ